MDLTKAHTLNLDARVDDAITKLKDALLHVSAVFIDCETAKQEQTILNAMISLDYIIKDIRQAFLMEDKDEGTSETS